MIDRITDEEQDRAHQDTYESEIERSRTVTIPLREYEKLKEVQKTITNKDCISIIDKIEELWKEKKFFRENMIRNYFSEYSAGAGKRAAHIILKEYM